MKILNFSLFMLLLVVFQMQRCHAQSSSVVDARVVVQLPSVLSESSGMAVATPNRLWSHNDAGNTNQLFCFDTMGVLQRTLLIANATNVDWEDLAVDDQGSIYINDAGNNQNDRQDLKIYRIPNPETIPEDVTDAEIINFMFEDQYAFPPPAPERNFDIEAMIWKSDSLFLFTKNRSNPQSGICKMYSLPAVSGFYVAKLSGSVYLGASNQEARVTAADINFQTGELVLLTSTKIVSFTNYPGNDFFDGEMNEHYFTNEMGQIEAIAFVDNTRIFLTEEGSGQNTGRLYEVVWDSVNNVNEYGVAKFATFPNPFFDKLYLDNAAGETMNVKVFDVNGKIILQKTTANGELALDELPAGIYFLHISTKSNYFATKILKF
jgi:hypothetical protein